MFVNVLSEFLLTLALCIVVLKSRQGGRTRILTEGARLPSMGVALVLTSRHINLGLTH